MAGLKYFFCMFLSFALLCSSFTNAQYNEESIGTSLLPADIRNALIALMKPFSDNKVAEQEGGSEASSDSEVLQTDLLQVAVACELSPLCPRGMNWAQGLPLATALPFGLFAAKKLGKLAKPKLWKVGLAIKVGFLKLIILKKLLLVKAKLKLIKAKPFIAKSPLVIAPILFAIVAANLGSQLGSSDAMLRNGSSVTPTAPAMPSLGESFLGPFAQIPGAAEELEIISSIFSGFFNPAQIIPGLIQGTPFTGRMNQANPIAVMFNPTALLSGEGAAIIPSLLGHDNEMAAVSHLFKNGLVGLGNMVNPNLRRLQSLPQFGDIPGVQQVARYVIADTMLDFVSILQLDDATRRDYNEYVEYAKDAQPDLTKAPLRDELVNVVKVPEGVMKVIDLQEDYNQESLSVSVREVDQAIIDYAKSIKNMQI